MMKRWIILALVLAVGGGMSAGAGTGKVAAPASQALEVVEYYHAGLDHYFMTADPSEIDALDTGALQGWARTGKAFVARSPDSTDANLSPVCRFYGLPAAGLDSHFYSGSPIECNEVFARFASSWVLESSDVFRIRMPDAATGSCPDATTAIYRLYNNRSDANHRYTDDPGVVAAMVAQGYILEGYGAHGVALCAEAVVAEPCSVDIVVTPMGPDTLTFGIASIAAACAAAVGYNWDFGDGSIAASATPTHQFAAPGTYAVAVAVADSQGVVRRAAKAVTATPAPIASDFATRRTAPGVVRSFDFDSAAQLGGGYGANFGVFAGAGTNATSPVLDAQIKASGASSMRFDVKSQSGSSGAGSWFANFSPVLGVQFGENTEFFIQWRQRFNDAFIQTVFRESGGGVQGGIKLLIASAGDQPGRLFNSCEAIGNVVQTYYQHRFPIAYNSCTGSGTHQPYSGFQEAVLPGPSDFLLQNGTAPFCKYSSNQASRTPTDVAPGCFPLVANEWMTFQIATTLGSRDNVNNDFLNSRFRLWGARDGQPSVLLIDWRPGIGGYFPLAAGKLADNERFGKVWLLPYMTNKDPTQIHDLAQTWYDELIISTQRIADPAPAVPR